MDWERSAVNGGSDALRSSSLAGALLSLTFCGDYVCCGAADHTIRLWDRESLHSGAVLCGHKGPVCSLAAWGQWLVSGGTDGTLIVWEVAAGRKAHSWLNVHRDAVRDITVGCDSCGEGDGLMLSVCDRGSMLLWRLGSISSAPSSWRCTRQLIAHSYAISAAILFTNSRAATGSEDSTIRIWEVRLGGVDDRGDQVLCTAKLQVRSAVSALAWGGGLLYSASEDRAIRAWAESSAIEAARADVTGTSWTCVQKVRLAGVDCGLRPWCVAVCAGRLVTGVFGEPARREVLVLGPNLSVSGVADSSSTVTADAPGTGTVVPAARHGVQQQHAAPAAVTERAMEAVLWRLPQAAGATVAAVREGSAGEVWAAIGDEIVVWGRC